MSVTFIDLWTRFQADQKQEARLNEFRNLTTEQLKAAWDAFDPDAEPEEDGYFWPVDAPHIEDVHRILNERGQGEYCAV